MLPLLSGFSCLLLFSSVPSPRLSGLATISAPLHTKLRFLPTSIKTFGACNLDAGF